MTDFILGHPHRVAPVLFQGHEYLLIGTKKHGGAIATQWQYDNMLDSYANLYEDGRILRYGRQIGTRDDLKLVRKKERK